MARLKAAQRRALPDSTFAGPGRSFPIPDKGHAKAALGLIGHAPPSARPKIRARAEAMLHGDSNSESHIAAHARHHKGTAMKGKHHSFHDISHEDSGFQAAHNSSHHVQVHGPALANETDLAPGGGEDGNYREHHELHAKAHPGDGFAGREGSKRHSARSGKTNLFT